MTDSSHTVGLHPFVSIVLTAAVTACLAAPLATLLLTLFGVEGTLRTVLVGSITAAVTATVVTRRQCAADAPSR